VAVLTETERPRILAEYLPVLTPHWDGSHLAWLWARIREQNVFFPWHERRLATRMDFPMPPPERQQAGVLEFLRAADHYHVAYRAAFAYRAEEVVPRLKVPALITAARWDPIAAHLARLGQPAHTVSIVGSETPQEALQRCLDHLAAHAAPAPSLRNASDTPATRVWRDVIDVDGLHVHLLRGGQQGAIPLLIVHDAGSSSRALTALAERLGQSRAVLAPDLPGHGESDGTAINTPVDVATCARACGDLLERLHIHEADVLGIGAGGAVALALAGRSRCKLRCIVWMDPPAIPDSELAAWQASGLPSLAADWHGGHLSRAWHMVRDARLYFPWFRRDQSAIRWNEPDLDERRIQLEVTERLKAEGAWQSLLADAWRPNVAQRVGAAGRASSTVLCAPMSSPWRSSAEAAATGAGCRFMALADEENAQISALLEAFSAAP
jgi:pimeloyl-ACP methyl ester carboxylesterase